MQPATEGTGIIAGGPMRAVFEVMGVTDVILQVHRIDQSLQRCSCHDQRSAAMSTPAEIAAKRGKSVEEILG
jgi:small subunit ribosomal protein S5